ncbi:MAG TPA: transglycosylase domain-containing protein [Conexibacter sp.]|nr:transglycosylase domain-containing protein [Conexibacter sp.]
MTDAHGNITTPTRQRARLPRLPRRRRRDPGRPRIKKLRVLSILVGLSLLAIVSTVFGMMMAVASDLPQLENKQQYRTSKNNSVLLDYRGRQLGILTNNQNVVLVGQYQIAPAMKHATIAIEDKRFYTNPGYDLKGIARALWADVGAGGSAQGASTITQQFVKVALEAQGERTVFQKLREAALAYHLTKKWPKDKILTEYLNAIYFGNGAYGIESAARVYFGKRHGWQAAGGCGSTRANMCASQLTTPEAAFLAGIIQSPSGYDPIAHPAASRARRDTVLRYMRDQGYITPSEYTDDLQDPLPTQNDLTPPQEKSESPYFTSWVRQQVVDHFGPFRAFSGNLQITTSLDLDLQTAAESAISQMLPAGSGLPSASLVAIDNKTGEVRAMVGGADYATSPFNLATQGQRQPGSTFKPFTLTAALLSGISPGSVWSSQPKQFVVPHSGGKEYFVVRNYGDAYYGSQTLASATTTSDNSVYADVGVHVGTRKIARVARRLGIRTPISTNLAMTLGGLRDGVTPLDMAHAYEVFATGGKRIWNPKLGAPDKGPIGIHLVRDGDGKVVLSNVRTLKRKQVIPAGVASEVSQILQTVVAYGTGKAAAIPGFAAGKTGTTENYGDAWFVGWNEQMTVAIWVGYPDRLVPMLTEYGGQPVAGGTYPAVLWHNFMEQAMAILEQRAAMAEVLRNGDDPDSVEVPSTDVQAAPTDSGTTTDSGTADGTAPATGDTGSDTGTGDTGGGGGGTVTPPAGGDTGTPAPSAGGDTGTPTPPATGGDANGGGAAAPSG